MFTMALPAPPTNGSPAMASLALISRLGWKRAGTRFNTRGVDDDGNTANFVEVGILPHFALITMSEGMVQTEMIFSTDQHCVSYVQVRGSVPCVYSSLNTHFSFLITKCFVVFWEQQGLQTFGQRIQITRPHASQPAFERHFTQLMDEYGSIHAINLLGAKENEASLTSAYDRHLQIARGAIGDQLSITHYDFHDAVKIGGHDGVIRELRYATLTCLQDLLQSPCCSHLDSIVEHVDAFGFSMCDAVSDDIVTDQKGIFRTNCLDW